MNTLSEARAEASAAERLVCLLAFEIARLNRELMGERRARAHGFRLGLCAWNDGAPPYEHRSGKSVKPGISVRPLPPNSELTEKQPERAAHKEENGARACHFSRQLAPAEGSARLSPTLTDTETLPPSRCQREAVRQHKPRNGLASPSAGDEHG